MSVSNIMSPYDRTNLGAVIYANSYFLIEKDSYLNITKNVPNL